MKLHRLVKTGLLESLTALQINFGVKANIRLNDSRVDGIPDELTYLFRTKFSVI